MQADVQTSDAYSIDNVRTLDTYMYKTRVTLDIDYRVGPFFKDARSVSLYPYNRSQILQYVKYTK